MWKSCTTMVAIWALATGVRAAPDAAITTQATTSAPLSAVAPPPDTRIASALTTASAPLPVSAPSSAPATQLVAPAGEPGTLFYRFDLDPDFTGAPDVSRRLPPRPLTAQDRIVRAGAHFVRVGTGTDDAPNGERLKIYGINLSFAANFPTAEMAPVVARRLRVLGFNGVRLHHMDTKPGRAATPESILTDGPFPSFNNQAVDRLKTFIAALAQEGIYVDLNLRVGYPFRSLVDDVPELPPSGETAPLHIFYPRMQALQAQYARALIERLGLVRNPVLAMVEINNESSLLYSYERGRLSAALTRPWREALGLRWRAWLKQREPGVSDAYADLQFTAVMAVRGETFATFLRDMDRQYLNELRAVVHAAAGWPVPVTGTQMGYGGQAYVQSHADMDYLDEHFYIDHYDFPGIAWSRTDWHFRNNDVTRTEMQKLAVSHKRRDPTRPWAMSEYNMAYPNQQGAAIMPVVAAMALAGDWDALYFFDYADGKVWNRAADSFTLSGDPAKMALTGQSAELFRAGQTAWMPYDWAFENGKSNDLFALETPFAAGIMGRQDKGKTYYAGPMTLTLDTTARGYATTLINALDRQPLTQSMHLLITHVAGTRGSEPGSQPLRPKALKRVGEFTLLAPDEQGTAGPGGPRDATGPMWLEYAPARLTLKRAQDAVGATVPVAGGNAMPDAAGGQAPDAVGRALQDRPVANAQPTAGAHADGTTKGNVAASTAGHGQRWTVYPLATDGNRLRPLAADAVSIRDGALQIMLTTPYGQASPWYEVVATPEVVQ